jgi:hypothetical protein
LFTQRLLFAEDGGHQRGMFARRDSLSWVQGAPQIAVKAAFLGFLSPGGVFGTADWGKMTGL